MVGQMRDNLANYTCGVANIVRQFRVAEDQAVDFPAARMQAYEEFENNILPEIPTCINSPLTKKDALELGNLYRRRLIEIAAHDSRLRSRLAQIDAMDPSKKKDH